jgi:hypothetical protein
MSLQFHNCFSAPSRVRNASANHNTRKLSTPSTGSRSLPCLLTSTTVSLLGREPVYRRLCCNVKSTSFAHGDWFTRYKLLEAPFYDTAIQRPIFYSEFSESGHLKVIVSVAWKSNVNYGGGQAAVLTYQCSSSHAQCLWPFTTRSAALKRPLGKTPDFLHTAKCQFHNVHGSDVLNVKASLLT